MAAQFRDVALPQPHERDRLVRLPDRDYGCRIVQMFDPEFASSATSDEPDFVVEFIRPRTLPADWSEVPWFET